MKKLTTLLLLPLFGCAPTAGGTYSGTITTSYICSDGLTIAPGMDSGFLTFTETGDTLSWATSCGGRATARLTGATATVNAFGCPAVVVDGATVQNSVLSGLLTLSGNSLRMAMNGVTVITGNPSATCSTRIIGTFERTR